MNDGPRHPARESDPSNRPRSPALSSGLPTLPDAVGPLARRLLTLAVTMLAPDPGNWAWLEVEGIASRILAELNRMEPAGGCGERPRR